MCQKKEYIVYSRRIMYKLQNRGFQYDYSRPNLTKPQFECYVYIWTPELQKVLNDIYEGRY